MEFGGLLLEVFPDVYEPAEDSFLLARHVKKLAEDMRNKRDGCTGNQARSRRTGGDWKPETGGAPRILDMGCGCGIISLACAKANPRSIVLGVDKNPRAVENAENNAKRNGIKNIEFAQSDLFSNVVGIFDAIIFNPPYLPTAKKEKLRGNLNLAFDGGRSGREVTGRFLAQFPKFLKRGGTLLMIESSLAGIEETVRRLEKSGFKAKIIDEEKFFFEKIVVIKAKNSNVNKTKTT